MERVNVKNYVKTVQRRCNAVVRFWNKDICNDPLWRGRFYLRQINREVNKFDDGSGAEIFFTLEMGDKKSGARKVFVLSNFELSIASEKRRNGGWKLFQITNNFIVEKVKVWDEDPRPNVKTAPDYTKVPALPPIKLFDAYKYYH